MSTVRAEKRHISHVIMFFWLDVTCIANYKREQFIIGSYILIFLFLWVIPHMQATKHDGSSRQYIYLKRETSVYMQTQIYGLYMDLH